MIVKRVLSLGSLLGTALSIPTLHERGVDFEWRSEELRGVNLGGWLVLEPWITPSVFEKINRPDIIDEYTLGEKLGRDAALEILRPHWDSWVTWHDFSKIKESGFNVVRLPVGYWAYDTFDSPYVSGSAVYVDAAIDWARSLGLKMIIDLHGASGSQNGYDNSGQKRSDPQFTNGDNIQKTLKALKTISDKYAQTEYHDVIIGIQLLNEPLIEKLDEGKVRQFYRDGYGQVREVSDTPVIIHDGFKPPNTWNGFLTPSDNNAQNVVVDHHKYQVFYDQGVAMQPWEHHQAVCNSADTFSGSDKWTFVGEWSGAMTDCAKYLNGYGVGARYDATYPGSTNKVGDCGWLRDLSQWSDQYKDDTRRYIEVQMDAYEARTDGWVWWNFKTESAPEWDAFKLIDAGIMPQPLTDRKFNKICPNL